MQNSSGLNKLLPFSLFAKCNSLSSQIRYVPQNAYHSIYFFPNIFLETSIKFSWGWGKVRWEWIHLEESANSLFLHSLSTRICLLFVIQYSVFNSIDLIISPQPFHQNTSAVHHPVFCIIVLISLFPHSLFHQNTSAIHHPVYCIDMIIAKLSHHNSSNIDHWVYCIY